jgi:hypothetical protein
MILMLISLCFLPKVVFGGAASDVARSGISGSEPRIMTYTLAVILIVLAAVISRPKSMSIGPLLPLLGFLLLSFHFVWEQTGEVQAGMVHFLTAIGAWVAGSYVSSITNVDKESGRVFIYWVAGITLLQLAIACLQIVGVQLFPTNAITSELVGSRVNGSFGHPTTLGKVLLLFEMLALPFTRSLRRGNRNAAWLTILASMPMLVLSGGRANFFAAMLALLLWTLFLPRGRALGAKFAIPIGAGIVAVASAGMWVSRFEEDPVGLTRQHFNDVALALIPDNPIAGTGPNTYITTAGPTDPLTAQGWPVHNSFLLASVEIGILGAALIFLPLLIVLLRSLRDRKLDNTAGDFSRAYVCTAPGIAMVAFSGWGMMSDALVLWMFVAGVCYQKQSHQKDSLPAADDLQLVGLLRNTR